MAKHDRWALFLSSSAVILPLIPNPSSAQIFQVTPSIGVEEKWTDNVLSTSSDQKADFITTVTPAINITGKGARVNVGLDYSLAYDRYAAQNDLDGMRHQGVAMAGAEVIEDLFSVDARGAISEKLINPTAAATADGRTAPSNQARVASYTLTPMLRHRFGSFAAAQARYRHDETKYLSTGSGSNTSPGISDSVGDAQTVGVRSGDDFTQMLWSYEFENVRREASTVFIQTSHTGHGEYRVNHDWGVLGHLGHDYLNNATLDSDQYSGVFYGGGLHWTPSPRTDVAAEVGHRYDGVNVFVKATQAIGERTQLKLSHNTGVTTEAESIATSLNEINRDPEGRLIDPFTGLAPDPTASPFERTDAAFKQTQTSLSVTHRLDRDTFMLTGSLATRESTGTVSNETTAIDVGASWTHQLTELLSSTAAISRSDIIEAPADSGKVERLRASLALNYAITPTLSSHAGYWFVDSQPETGNGVTENLVAIGFRKQF
ncbi:MAG: TIGR03016 family PEP-CTERM system-associated outer membrane protein [Rhodospirillaceae bacterium]|nr:TIGR03016 family PEP-CTERM system-associated outer membrane protein [Rhodospirillales bacterium]